MKLIITLMVFTALLSIQKNYGQEENRNRYDKSVSLSLLNEHIAVLFSEPDGSPTHLGFAASYELSKERTGMYRYTHVFQAGYYYHKGFNQAAFVAWKPKFELRFAQTVDVHAILGVGYAHSFPTEASYKLKDGKYEKATNWGKSHFLPSIGLGAGLHLEKWLDVPIATYVRYESFSLAPYASKTDVSLTLNTMLSFGITYSFHKK